MIFKVSLPAAFWWHYIPLYYSIPFFGDFSLHYGDCAIEPGADGGEPRHALLTSLHFQWIRFSSCSCSTRLSRFSPLSKIQWLASGLGLGFLATDRLTVSLPFVNLCKNICARFSLVVKWKITWVGATKCARVFRCTITWFLVCKIKFSYVLSPGFWFAK